MVAQSWHDNADFQLRCLSGCGSVITCVVISDHQLDYRIIRPQCPRDDAPRLNIFVSEQTWRNGIKRISYRHDGNYVIFDNDMRVASEGRVEPLLVFDGNEVDERLASEYRRIIGNPHITVSGTQTIAGTSSNAFCYDPNSPSALSEYQRQAALLAQREAARQREEIWREYRDRTVRPEEYERRHDINTVSEGEREMMETYRRYTDEAIRKINGVAIADPQPRPSRLVRRRALEKKDK